MYQEFRKNQELIWKEKYKELEDLQEIRIVHHW